MGSVEVSDHKRPSLWNMIACEPLYIIIPNLLIVRPSRLLFNYYIKPAKFLMIVLPRNIWRQVRRNETICCLIGFGIGVGCCILYRLISNFLAPSSSSSSSTTATLLSNHTVSTLSNNKRDVQASLMGQEHSSLSSTGHEVTVTYTKRPRPTLFKRTTPERCSTSSLPSGKTPRSEPHPNDGDQQHDADCEPLLGLPIDKHHDYVPTKNLTSSHLSDQMTWSEISSSLGTVGHLHESYHSNSLTGDSGVDCHDISIVKSSRVHHPRFNDTATTMPLMDDYDDDDSESLMNYTTNGMTHLSQYGPRRYDSDTALSRGVLLQDTQSATESHMMSYMSTEKGLDRALEQTSRFYSDLEHIATDLNSLSKRYSHSQVSLTPSLSKYYHQHNRPVLNTIDALDWDWNDVHSPPLVQSPKSVHRKAQQQYSSSSLPRLNTTKTKLRRRLLNDELPTDYNESDLEIRTSRSYDCTSSPLKRRPSSVYFDSTDNTSGDEYVGDETLRMPSGTGSVLAPLQNIESMATSK